MGGNMPSSFCTIGFPLFVFSFIIFSPLSSSVTTSASDKTLKAICTYTFNYDYCRSIIDSNPRTKKADLKEVAIIAVLAATSQARVNKYVVDDLQHKETDPTMKARLTDCFSDYTVTLGKLSMAYRLFDREDYKGMERWVNDAMKMTTKCESRFWRPPKQPCPIADYSQKMVWVNSIVLSVLSMLDHHH